MTEQPIIHVENVSKQFSLTKHFTLRHELMPVLQRLRGRQMQVEQEKQFYALKDVSFDIERGESVAIIGRNGSGKSTLLRILARIMRPTDGVAQVNGKFVALISLGTGFISKMTGRDNIYLNAAFYGLRKHEVDEILPQIIEFADIGTFIDQPVQDYSSGMTARLGFSVAIHILPDVIFLDEILSVGDKAFRDECLERMYQLRKDQRTIIFVSHSQGSVERLCDRAIWLDKGQIQMDGPVKAVYKAYNAASKSAR